VKGAVGERLEMGRVDVRRQHMAAVAGLVGHPGRDGAAAGADLQTAQPGPDPEALQQRARPVVPRRLDAFLCACDVSTRADVAAPLGR
jgi:hypothetical protein